MISFSEKLCWLFFILCAKPVRSLWSFLDIIPFSLVWNHLKFTLLNSRWKVPVEQRLDNPAVISTYLPVKSEDKFSHKFFTLPIWGMSLSDKARGLPLLMYLSPLQNVMKIKVRMVGNSSLGYVLIELSNFTNWDVFVRIYVVMWFTVIRRVL